MANASKSCVMTVMKHSNAKNWMKKKLDSFVGGDGDGYGVQIACHYNKLFPNCAHMSCILNIELMLTKE